MIKKIKIGLIAVTCIIFIAWLFIWPYRTSGNCMEPAVKDGQFVFLNRMAPYIRHYQIGDIILFKHDGKVWISRIVALETDTIQIAEGKIIVNGVILQEPTVHRNWANWMHGEYAISKPLQVSRGHVFVLSDNLSAQHDDSRFLGPISKKSILGLVW